MNISREETLKQQIHKLIEGTPFHLIDFKIGRLKKRAHIKIVLDREDDFISHEDCRNWSSQIQDIIDAKNLIEDDYRLEVSSPGVGRPLTYRWEYDKNLEKNLSVDYIGKDDEVQNFTGIMIEADDYGIILKDKKQTQRIPWDTIKRARVKLPW